MPYNETLYSETIGPATVKIGKIFGIWTVSLKDTAAGIDRERIFPPCQKDSEGYESAIRAYDGTCEAASRLYNTPRPMPEKPDFSKTTNL